VKKTGVISAALLIGFFCSTTAAQVPASFVDVSQTDSSIVMDIRYAGPHNFIGEKIDGYDAPKCLLTREAAKSLAEVQADLKRFSLSLKVYDCYRPQRSVDRFVEWGKALNDQRMKAEFYPNEEKKDVFDDGYIAKKSSHSRGSTVDLTIVPIPLPQQEKYRQGQKLSSCELPANKRFKDNSIDMGTGFDCFSELSHPENPEIGSQQRTGRALLRIIMEKHGFASYDKEWWHFTLKDEPFPKTFFDFVIE
jgi:zinc D-Ala-D-Ala dipeptidase